MKKLIFGLLSLISYASAFPQSGWVSVSAPGAWSQPVYVNLDFVDENTGYLNRDRIYKSTNGGVNWSPVTTTIGDYTKIKFFNSGTGYIWVSNMYPQLAKTTNSGENWTSIGFGNEEIKDIQFLNSNTGFITIDHNNSNYDTLCSVLRKTTDGGNSWKSYKIADSVTVNHISFCNENTGYVCSYGRIYKTTNGGANWRNTNGNNYVNLGLRFIFTTENNGWSVTDSTRITRTTDGGVTWQKQYHLSKALDIFFLNPSTGWFCRDRVYKTTNAGENWFAVSDSGIAIWEVKFINENTGWCYTGNNKILITHNGGSVFIAHESEEIPDNFSLSQNYPNPFNPDTKIKFNIRKSEFVKLTVYDINGKIISTLVNGNLAQGIYSVDFSGKNLSSGTYFYKIEAGNYKDVKRMVLVK